MQASDYIESRIKYLSLYSLDETALDQRVFERRGRHIVRDVNANMIAERRAAAERKRDENVQKKQQKALELKTQREAKAAERKIKTRPTKVARREFKLTADAPAKSDATVASQELNTKSLVS